jgi:site-specific DNA-adenine methylase
MEIPYESFILIDCCSATGSLFFGLRSHPWKSVILNDLNPLRTNFLNVIKTEPLKLIKQILESDLLFIEQPETKNPKLSSYKKAINDNSKKRAKYHKVDCNIDIAYQMFIVQCINKAMVESAGKIMERSFRFLPAHLKLQNAVITQQDCLNNLKNDNTNKLFLLDVPYIGSEHTYAVTGYKYQPFHQKVADFLQNAEYPFLYYCRSTPPKSDSSFNREDAEHIMKMKLG